MSNNPEIELAVLKSQVDGLREQHKEQSNLLRGEIQDLKIEVKILIEQMNKGKGALSILLFSASCAGAAIALLGKMLVYGKPL